jgi:hypothetical protein
LTSSRTLRRGIFFSSSFGRIRLAPSTSDHISLLSCPSRNGRTAARAALVGVAAEMTAFAAHPSPQTSEELRLKVGKLSSVMTGPDVEHQARLSPCREIAPRTLQLARAKELDRDLAVDIGKRCSFMNRRNLSKSCFRDRHSHKVFSV